MIRKKPVARLYTYDFRSKAKRDVNNVISSWMNQLNFITGWKGKTNSQQFATITRDCTWHERKMRLICRRWNRRNKKASYDTLEFLIEEGLCCFFIVITFSVYASTPLRLIFYNVVTVSDRTRTMSRIHKRYSILLSQNRRCSTASNHTSKAPILQ